MTTPRSSLHTISYEKATEDLDAGKPLPPPPPSKHEVDLWENGRLECLAKLTRWNDLAENTLAEVDGATNRLWEEQYIDPYLNYFMESHIKLKERWPELWDFIDSANAEQKEFLESKFGSGVYHHHVSDHG